MATVRDIINTYTSNLRKIVSTALGCCDQDLQGKVRNRSDFDSFEPSGNTLGLINMIWQKGYRVQSAKYTPVTYHQTHVKFYRLSKGRDGHSHTVSDHLKHHSDMFDLTKRA